MIRRGGPREEPYVRVAQGVVVLAPLLGFDVLGLPGLATLALVLPVIVLGFAYCTRPGARIPVWELLMLAAIASSVWWSDDPAYTVERLRTYVPLLLATILATSVLDGRQVLRCLEVSFTVLVGSSILTLIVDPASRNGTGSGLVLIAQFPKNEYGALLCFALALVLARRRRWNVPVAALLIVLIALNYSVTAWTTATVLVLVTLTARWIFRRLGPAGGRVPLAATGLGATLAAGLAVIFTSDSLLAVVGKDPTLSDRTAIWQACWQEILRAPLLGHGAYTFLEAGSVSPVSLRIWSHFTLAFLPPHPHNGLLVLWGQLGMLGIIVFTGLVFATVRAALRAENVGTPTSNAALLGLLVIMVFSATETTYLGPFLVLTLCYSALATPASPLRTTPATPDAAVPERRAVMAG